MWLKKTMYSRLQRIISWKEITILFGKYGTHGEDLRDATISQQLRHFAVVWSKIPGIGRTEPCSIHPPQPPINPPHTLGPRAIEIDWFNISQYWHGTHIVHMVRLTHGTHRLCRNFTWALSQIEATTNFVDISRKLVCKVHLQYITSSKNSFVHCCSELLNLRYFLRGYFF